MSEPTIIHCLCRRGAWDRILAIILPDGRLEIRQDGKSSIVSGGRVELSCSRCGFERELALDKSEIAVVA